MSTRSRKNGKNRRMAGDVSPTSKVDCTSKSIGKRAAPTDTEASGAGRQGCETRSQSNKTCISEQSSDKETKPSSTCGTANSENSSTFIGVSTRSSTRPLKRQRTSSVTSGQEVSPGKNSDAHQVQDETDQPKKKKAKKTKRQWESWGNADKNAFFEALVEHGKDFDKIQTNIASKHKRRGDPPELVKNKDQVRHFYYRTLNKIAPYLPTDKAETTDASKKGECSDASKKANYELIGLLCYGELRKRKMRNFSKKEGQKLQEMILQGTTTIRASGRNQKVKMPTCRALKKQNQQKVPESVEVESEKPPPIPSKLTIVLQPKDNQSWISVQKLSKNPRLRTQISSQKTLSSLLNYLNSKWAVSSGVSDEKAVLCLYPQSTLSITTKAAVSRGSSSVSSPVFPETGNNQTSTNPKPVKTVGFTSTGSGDCSSGGIRGEQCTPEGENTNKPVNGTTEAEAHASSENGQKATGVVETVIKEDSSDGMVCESSANATDTKSNKKSEDNSKDEQSYEDYELAPKMWNASNCEGITLGDLYLEFGRPENLKLEYNWMYEKESTSSQVDEALRKLVFIASTEFYEKTEQSKKAAAAKAARATKQGKASPPKTYVSMDHKIVNEPVFVMPAVVPSVVRTLPSGQAANLGANQLATNHKTFGFTPIREFTPPEPLLPKSKKRARRPPRVVVQRTILPRPVVRIPGAVAVSYVAQPSATGKVPIAPQRSSSVPQHAFTSLGPVSPSTIPTGSPGTSRGASPSIAITDPQQVGINTSNIVTSTTNILDLALSNAALNNLTSTNPTFTTVLGNNGKIGVEGISTTIASTASSTISSTGFSLEGMNTGSATPNPVMMQPNLTIEQVNTGVTEHNVHIEEVDSGVAMASPLPSDKAPNTVNLSSISPGTLSNLSQILNSNNTIVVVGDGVDLSALGLASSNSGNTEPNQVMMTADPSMSSNSVTVSANASMNSTPAELTSSLVVTSSLASNGGLSVYPSLGSEPAPSISGVSDIHLSPPASPLQLNPLGVDGNWLNGEGPDISLGSLFENLDNKSEKRHTQESGTAELRDDLVSLDGFSSVKHLLDVESALHSMMEENSVDYVNRFQDFYTHDTFPTQLTRTTTTTTTSRGETESSNSANGHLSFSGLLNGQNLNTRTAS